MARERDDGAALASGPRRPSGACSGAGRWKGIGMDAEDGTSETKAFLVVDGTATLRFDADDEQVAQIISEIGRLSAGIPEGDVRNELREALRVGLLDDDHLDPVKSQALASAVVWLCMTSNAAAASPQGKGFILEITRKPDGSRNFRYAVSDDHRAVDAWTEQARAGRNYVVTVTAEEARKAAERRRTPVSRDPSLDPPPKPRPERWLAALEANEKTCGKAAFASARTCLETAACFVWKSRQFADAAREEIDASLSAMAEYDRLHLPFPLIWAETRDWIDVPVLDAPSRRVEARFAVAAVETDGRIEAWGFADFDDRIIMSALRLTVDVEAIAAGRRRFDLETPPPALRRAEWDEATHRRISQACGDALLELLFLLSCSGVARETVRQGNGGKQKKRHGQRRMSARDYTVVRVPLVYEPAAPGSEGRTGRWVRVHCRRAHTWGVNTRPEEKRHWRPACLVGAPKGGGTPEVARPDYRLA